MSKLRDLLRPLFRIAVHRHINQLCKKTEEEFAKYKDAYTGKRCFIVANGPSLRMDDLDRFVDNNEITFGMNRIYELYDRTKWRPTFYLSQDPTVIRACLQETVEQTKNSIVFVKVPGEKKYDIPGAINYDLDYTNVDKHIPPDFYDGSNCLFADGKSVTHTAFQLAVYMGFKDIYIIGADCNYSSDNKSINKDSYPDSRMYDAKKVGIPPDMEYTFSAYRVVRKYAEKHGINVYNATRGGMLEELIRVDLDSLF